MSATAACPACVAAAPAAEAAASHVPNLRLSIPSVHCAACIAKVEQALNALDGVTDARVNLTLKRVGLHSTRPTEDLVAALGAAGYDAYPLDETILGQDQDPVGRDLTLRLGIAGFAMMNVMLLSVAVWSGAADATRDLFHLISAAISLPVVLYSGQPFFKSAWRALSTRGLNMDVPISLAILLAAGMSLYESLASGQHAYFDAALSLTFFLLIGRLMDHRTRATARSAARELAALEVHTAQRLREGRVETVPLTDLVLNDHVVVATGMRVPVDGTLVDGSAITDRSFLTGESDAASSMKGDTIRSGEVNLGPAFTLTATAVGEDTSLRRIASLVEQAENAKTKYTSLADRASQVYAPAVHLLALAAFLGWYAATGDLRFALNVAIAVLIITCPCALGLAVPAVSTAAIGRLYELGFLVKSGTALERLAEVRRVVFDKTGTLTQPSVRLDTAALSATDRAIAKALADRSQHPVAKALAQDLRDVTPADLDSFVEFPSLGISALYNGTKVRLGQGCWVGAATPGLALGIGDRTQPLGQEEVLRTGAADAAKALARQGLSLALVTGDAPERAHAVGDALGLTEIYAATSPDNKHRMIQEDDRLVAMIGDGLNDTAALAAAHASVAPSSALDASRNAADVVMLRDGLDELPTLFKISRKATKLCQQNFAIATLYNIVAVPIALAGFATPLIAALAMSTSSLTVLINAMRVRSVK